MKIGFIFLLQILHMTKAEEWINLNIMLTSATQKLVLMHLKVAENITWQDLILS